jgi:hypothetical protein
LRKLIPSAGLHRFCPLVVTLSVGLQIYVFSRGASFRQSRQQITLDEYRAAAQASVKQANDRTAEVK